MTTLVKEAVEHSRSELAYYRGQCVPLENISVSLRGDLLEALLASLPTDDDWQPIETAPKDGTPILVFFDRPDLGVLRVTWDDPHDSGYYIWCVDDNKHGPYSVRGYSDGDDKAWKPLPGPPAIHTLIGRAVAPDMSNHVSPRTKADVRYKPQDKAG